MESMVLEQILAPHLKWLFQRSKGKVSRFGLFPLKIFRFAEKQEGVKLEGVEVTSNILDYIMKIEIFVFVWKIIRHKTSDKWTRKPTQ